MHINDAVPNPVFANHETFHLRYGWLKKAYNLTIEYKDLFRRDDAPVLLGVGKNMVRAIRFWGMAGKVLETVPNPEQKNKPFIQPTEFGNLLFDDKKGLDPYMEKSDTLWLLHWMLLAPPCQLPVWWIIMNEFSVVTIGTDSLTESTVSKVGGIPEWKTPSPGSIKKDIDVFIHTYTSKPGKILIEDYLDCPFRHLHVLRQNSDSLRFVYGRKYGLSPMITAYACLDFIDRSGSAAKTMSVRRLATEAGGVGNAFKISEDDLAELLAEAADTSDHISIQNINGASHLSFEGTVKEAASAVLAETYKGTKRRYAMARAA